MVDDIRTHRRKLIAPYAANVNAGETVRSAKNLARLILAGTDISDSHKKRILSEVLWMISNADGKHKTRFRSREVVRLANDDPTSQQRIQHEHVFPREVVTEEILRCREGLLANPGRLNQMLDLTVGCIVTAQEHASLQNNLVGWARYHQRVEVLDMSTIPPTTHVYVK